MRSKVAWVVVGLWWTAPARAQWAVFDSSNFAQSVKQLEEAGRQLQKLEATYQKLEATYRAATGVRGFGDVLNNPALRQWLPDDWARVYDAASKGAYAGISGSLSPIQRAEQLTGSVKEMQAALAARGKRTAEADKAVGLQGYAGAKARLGQIEGLRQQISQTKDPKGIAELQARIAVEQAALQEEETKLRLVAMLQRAEERLIEVQRSELAQKILNGTGMPPCCSTKP